MRSDPSDNGGLFVGRRAGTAPGRFRSLPKRGSERRRRPGDSFAGLLCWGPIPLACLWLGSQANSLASSVSVGILVSFAALFGLLFGTLMILRRLDSAWILVRRAAGHDQRTGILGRIFAITAAVGAVTFAVWFIVIHGPGSSSFSGGGGV